MIGGRGPQLAAAFALFDGLLTALVLGSLGLLKEAAFLIPLSSLWAASRFSSSTLLLIPGCIGSLAAAASLFDPQGFHSAFYLPAAGIALILTASSGWKAPKRRIIPLQSITESDSEIDKEENIHVLKEAYRSLRDHYHRKERAARIGCLAKKMLEASFSSQPWAELSKALQDDLGLRGIRIYATGHLGSRLVWRAGSGPMPDSPLGGRSVAGGGGYAALKNRVDSLMGAIKQDEPDSVTSTQVIRDQGKVCALIVMDADTDQRLKEAEERIAPALSLIGRTISHIAKWADDARRVKESEILYSVVSLAKGAASQEVLADRILQELKEIVPADRFSLVKVSGGKAVTIAQHGSGPEPINLYSFAKGPGWQGWLKTSIPELHLLDPAEDTRVDAEAAFKSRIRCVCHLPLMADDEIIGWISASSSRSGALDEGHLTTLRIVASEAGPAIASASAGKAGRIGSGLASPKEFIKSLQTVSDGVIVAVEVPAIDELRRRFGSAALAQALNRASRMLSAKAPPGSLVCRRAEGDFFILIRGTAQQEAQSWANEIAASAALITLNSPDGSQRLSLALRAKVLEEAGQTLAASRIDRDKVPA